MFGIVLPDLKEKFINIRLLQKCKTDPIDEPYKSKYAARDILYELVKQLEERSQNDCMNNSEYKESLAIIYYLIAGVSCEVDETSLAEEYTRISFAFISEDPVQPNRIICAINCLNHLGYIECNNANVEESLVHLEQAEALYHAYKDKFNEKPPDFDMLFTGEADKDNVYEKSHTETLFFLAQAFGVASMKEKSAKYCHNTLQRQWDAPSSLDPVDWSLNCASLSQFLLEENAFFESKHHLAAATKILEDFLRVLGKDSDKENFEPEKKKSIYPELLGEECEAMKEVLRCRLADIYRCWGKYGIFMLSTSKDRLLDEGTITLIPSVNLRGLYFTGFGEGLKNYEALMPSQYILTYEDAKPVFLKTGEFLNKAKAFHTLQDHATEHIEIVEDISKLHLLLSFFQPDESIQCKLHKRRLDMLEPVINALNPTYYMTECRRAWFEMAEITVAMGDLKLQKKNDKDNLQLMTKVNNIHTRGIEYFEKFIKSFDLKRTEKYHKFPEEYEKCILMAFMYLGRLYYKISVPDKSVLLEMSRESLRCYKTFVDYCKEYEEAKATVVAEYGICAEMVTLIPLRMSKIIGQM